MAVKRSEIHGAKWWKVDFHNHTPASFDYGKGPNQPSLKSITAREWLLDYMSKEIDCVVISDHNTGEWIDILKAELAAMEAEEPLPAGFREIYLYPAVEISVSGGFHLLGIYDLDSTTADIDQLLGAVEFQGERGNSDGVTRKTCEECIEIIHTRGGVAIPAHVNLDGSGLFKKLSGNSLKQVLSVDGLLAIEVTDTAIPKPAIYEQLTLNLAQVIGSDSHHPLSDSQSRIGQFYTWVKMEKPSLEALRLALHDGSDGIIRFDEATTDPNIVGNRFFIKRIEVKDGYLAGRGANSLLVDFSPWLSTLIGGRGTGKSSIVNFMRLGLDQKSDMPDSIQGEFDRFCQVVTQRGAPGMLTNTTKLSLTLVKDGRLIKIEWDKESDLFKEFEFEESSGWIENGDITNTSDLYPVNIFNQKELFELTHDPSALLEIIDRQYDRKTIDERIAELTEQWLEQRSELRRIQGRISEEGNINAELNQIQAKLTIFEDEGNQEIFEDYKNGKEINNRLGIHLRKIKEFESQLDEVFSGLIVNSLGDVVESNIDENSRSEIRFLNEEYATILVEFEDLRTRLSLYNLQFETKVPLLPWQGVFANIDTKYRELLEEIADPEGGTQINHEELISRKEVLEQRLSEIESQKVLLAEVLAKTNELRSSILNSEKEIQQKRKEVIQKANEKIATVSSESAPDSPRLKIALQEFGSVEGSEKDFRNLIRKAGSTFSKDILVQDEVGRSTSGLIHTISSAPNSEDRWTRRDETLNAVLAATNDNPNGFDRRFVAHIEYLKDNTPEDIDRLLIWVPHDEIRLILVSGNDERSIETGSAGQRTAGMLTLLMSLGDEPLIIDQPEDDLDTRLITDLVVEGFRKLKSHRQLIVVTHNPNVAVNACAENIVEMKIASGQITAHVYGALQNRDSRHAVCEVMEGGKTALDNRYFRISKAIS